ncbi:DMT family transporter [Vitiosangium sp. GDMCC 1.1324]|uniref:DMT family transporter n=1 Tax=Vitiosangium sp. (strain GDMCC 1.1324) TaxID=2138576 RepID=UPI000D359176|nr:EamA family transporter [Vitiosangium sp. GDMCC 1.1324]PTL79583.1 EamA family transporter [Vitiosangium sp. GDMCC 1.1324]
MNRIVGILLILLSGASFGALGIFGRVAYASGANTPTVLFLRFSSAALVLGAVMLVRRTPLPRGRVLGGLVLLGAVGYVGQSLAYFTALKHASAGLTSLLLYLFPALVALLAVVVDGERMSRVRAMAIVLALGGTALTIDLNGGASAKGIVFGVMAALVYAVYVFTSARVAGSAGPLAASTVILGSAGVVYGLLMAAQGPAWPQTAQGWMAIGALSLFSTVVAVLTFFAGMERVGPVVTSLLSTVEPLVAVLLGAFVLDERLSLLQGVGGLLILTAVVLLARPEKPLAATLPPASGSEPG